MNHPAPLAVRFLLGVLPATFLAVLLTCGCKTEPTEAPHSVQTEDRRATATFPLAAVPMNIIKEEIDAGIVRIEQYEVNRTKTDGFIFYQAHLPVDPADLLPDGALDGACDAMKRPKSRIEIRPMIYQGFPARDLITVTTEFATRSFLVLQTKGVHLYMMQVKRRKEEALYDDEAEAFLNSLVIGEPAEVSTDPVEN